MTEMELLKSQIQALRWALQTTQKCLGQAALAMERLLASHDKQAVVREVVQNFRTANQAAKNALDVTAPAHERLPTNRP